MYSPQRAHATSVTSTFYSHTRTRAVLPKERLTEPELELRHGQLCLLRPRMTQASRRLPRDLLFGHFRVRARCTSIDPGRRGAQQRQWCSRWAKGAACAQIAACAEVLCVKLALKRDILLRMRGQRGLRVTGGQGVLPDNGSKCAFSPSTIGGTQYTPGRWWCDAHVCIWDAHRCGLERAKVGTYLVPLRGVYARVAIIAVSTVCSRKRHRQTREWLLWYAPSQTIAVICCTNVARNIKDVPG
ncbi:hypothetical protein C2E23DRAFT_842830 [Lenzites betulinus]|nr:hypothetical protein C2E23DRAFT_842830 [Lenzites betulinus]